MVKKTLWSLLLVWVNLHLSACSNTPSFTKTDAVDNNKKMDTDYQKVAYDTAILSIDKKCESCETWDALFSIKEFMNLYEHSSYYLADCISFLSNPKYNDKQKKVCICSMQGVSLEEYIKIVRQCQILCDAGNLSEDIVGWAIAPNFSKRHLIVRNYSDENVKNLLNSIHDNKNTSTKLKGTIEKILSGALWYNIKASEGV